MIENNIDLYQNKKGIKQFFFNLKNKIILMTITNIKLVDGFIYCAYGLSFATRIHHLPIIDRYKLPEEITSNFSFKYFSSYEKEFLQTCKACNETLQFSKKHPENEFVKFSTGKEMIIMIYNLNNKNHVLEFKINDLSKFTGLCRRYQTPTEVEKIIMEIFRKRTHA